MWKLCRCCRHQRKHSEVEDSSESDELVASSRTVDTSKSSDPVQFEYNPDNFSPFLSSAKFGQLNLINDYFNTSALRRQEVVSQEETSSSEPSHFQGFPLLSNKDFSDFEFCDEFTVEEMARDGWERLTDEENVQAYARDFGQSGLKQVRAWATIYGYRPEVLFNCIWDFDLSKQWGDACTDDLLAETIVSVCGLGSD